MDDDRRLSIRNALQSYRDRVLELNFSLLQSVIDQAANMQAPKNRVESEEKTQYRRVRAVAEECFGRGHFDGLPATTLEDFLSDDVAGYLISRYSLDGVYDDPVDWPVRSTWLARLNDAIATAELDAGKPRPDGLPADLEYLCTLAKCICGPGLPWWRDMQQIDFLTCTSEIRIEKAPKTAARVIKGMRNDPAAFDFHAKPCDHHLMDNHGDDIAMNWEDWSISLAVLVGKAEVFSGAGTYALYCRRLMPDPEEEDMYDPDDEEVIYHQEWRRGHERWKWRYGMHDGEWESDLYDTVEEFLGWYATCKQPKVEHYHVGSLSMPEECRPAARHLQESGQT